MISGSGNQAHSQEPARQREESNAAAAAAAAEPPPPTPPSECLQRRVIVPLRGGSRSPASAESPPHAPPSEGHQEGDYGPPGIEGQSPSAAAAERKGKKAVAPSPPSSAGRLPIPHPVVSVSGAGEPSSNAVVDRGRRASFSSRSPVMVGVSGNHVYLEVYNEMLWDSKSGLDGPQGEADELERQQKEQEQVLHRHDTQEEHGLLGAVKGVARGHAHLGWNTDLSSSCKVLETIGRQMHCFNQNSTVLEPHVNHQTIPTARIIEHYVPFDMVAGQGVIIHSNELNLHRAFSEFRLVHRDGECFYRTFIFSYLDQAFAVLKRLVRQYVRLGLTFELTYKNKILLMLLITACCLPMVADGFQNHMNGNDLAALLGQLQNEPGLGALPQILGGWELQPNAPGMLDIDIQQIVAIWQWIRPWVAPVLVALFAAAYRFGPQPGPGLRPMLMPAPAMLEVPQITHPGVYFLMLGISAVISVLGIVMFYLYGDIW